MLKELSQSNNEKGARRWFSDEHSDLIVWLQDDAVSGFQLCYDKKHNERAITWKRDGGYLHERVDDGEKHTAENLSPILVPEGPCPIHEVIELFISRSPDVDPMIRSFVLEKLRAFPPNPLKREP